MQRPVEMISAIARSRGEIVARRRKAASPPLARLLLDSAAAQARRPPLYAAMGVPDTTEGRFELVVVHLTFLAERLKAVGAADLAQRAFDLFVRDLDGALREMAVGDLAVPRRMRDLFRACFGRAIAWRDALARLPDTGEADSVVGRTLLASAAGVDPAPLTRYLLACRDALEATAPAALLAGDVSWPAP